MTEPSKMMNSMQRELLDALFWLGRLLRFRIEDILGPRVLETASGMETGAAPAGPPIGWLDKLLEELAETLETDYSPPDAPPTIPRGGWIPTLAARFGLNPLEALIVVAAEAPSVDGRFSSFFGVAQGNDKPERCSVDLLGRLVALSVPDRMWLSSRVRPGVALERYGLVRLDWSGASPLPPNRQPLEVPERVRWFLLDASHTPETRFFPYLRARDPGWSLETVPLPDATLERLRRFCDALQTVRDSGGIPPALLLEGPVGSGQAEAAECVAHSQGLKVIELKQEDVSASLDLADRLRAIRREVRLQDALVVLNLHSDAPQPGELELDLHLVLDDDLRDLGCPVVLMGNQVDLGTLKQTERPLFHVSLQLPDRDLQVRSLELALARNQREAARTDIEGLLNRYNLDIDASEEVVRIAGALAWSSRGDQRKLFGVELESALETILTGHLGRLSRRLSLRYRWEDLVLPEDVIVQLRTVKNLIEHRHKVFEEWGLGRKASSGKGIKVMFTGPSGTGKTMAAEVIASDLHMPLHRVDLSSVVSKWVGETEKNLERIFSEAQRSQAMLLFDEADALFGKRGTVDNANDRHANLEVSFLLQRFETHDGVVILTSNFPTIIDTAFSRRMHFLIEFPRPDEELRQALWQKMLQPPLPRARNLDLPFLAQRFEITGANICNVVLGAAFLAAAEERPVGMNQIVRALQWECQKLGRSVSSSDFGKYYRYLDIETDKQRG